MAPCASSSTRPPAKKNGAAAQNSCNDAQCSPRDHEAAEAMLLLACPSRAQLAKRAIDTSKMPFNAALSGHSSPPTVVALCSSDSHFRLLDLPPELWVRTAHLAIDNEPAFPVGAGRGSFWAAIDPESHHYRKFRFPALLSTCSSLRNECRSYYISSVKFDIYENHFGSDIRAVLGKWLYALGKGKMALQGIRFLTWDDKGLKEEELVESYKLRAGVFGDGEVLAEMGLGPQVSFVGTGEEIAVDDDYEEYTFSQTVTFL